MTFYDEETAIEESTKYFDEDSLAGKTWVNKYALTDEKGRFLESNPEQMHDRIIKEVMRIEKKYSNPQLTEEKLKEMMYHFKYIVLGGSGMSGIGNDYKYSSLSNCFVIESPTDSYGGICKSDQELLQLMKRRGGVGMDLSKLRPKGTAVTNDAKTSSGAVSFMERFSNSTREVSQNGRRGALMLSLEVTHPDAELFIDSKLDTSKITGANVSVKVTDKFMDAVKSGRKFLQKFPIDTPDEDLSIDPNKEYVEDKLYNGGKEGTYFKFVDAKRIWDKIIKNAWASAEPGVMFFDNMLKESPADIYNGYQTVSTNPCLSGDSKILMADGSRKKISEIVKGDEVISFDMDTCTPVKTKVINSSKTKSNAEVISLGDLRLTPDHKVACPVSNEYKEAKDVRFVRTMESKSSMVLRNGENYDVNVGKGFLSSLGVRVELNNPVTGEFNIVVFGNKYFYSENLVEFKLLNYLLTHYPGKVEQNPDPIDGEKYRFKVDSLYFNVVKKRKKLHVSIKDTGGNMSPENLKMLVDVIESLEYSFFTKEEVEDCMILRMQAPCGAYNIDEVYPRKIEEREDVYDIQLNVIHNFFAEGILVHNCGEIPLCPNDSCRLLSINLSSLVDDPFTKIASVNIKKLDKVARIAQRIMDNVIDLEAEHIEKIIDKVKSDPENDDTKRVELELWEKILDKTVNGRRTGIGITGLGDLLAKIGVTYGSEESIKIAELIQKTISSGCYAESINLAKERGPFNNYNRETEFNIPEGKGLFLKRMMKELPKEDIENWKKYGRRNIACLTIAPTGTVSIMTQTTSGIEPAFSLWYLRRKKTTDKSKAVFTDASGDMYEEFLVVHKGFVDWYQVNNKNLSYEDCTRYIVDLPESEKIKLYEKSPYYLSTSKDINWVNKVRLQGAMQRWIDHSISCTVNVPENTTVETVSEIYMAGYDSGCKGLTIYRDKSRDGVLVNASSSNSESINLSPDPRPESLEAKVYRFKNGADRWIAFVGVLNNHPYELFLGKIDDGFSFLPKQVSEGIIKKVPTVNEDGSKGRRYDFFYKTKFGYDNVFEAINEKFVPEFWNYARMLSGVLRLGIPTETIVKEIVDKLSDDGGIGMNTWKKGVKRALTKHINDGVKSTSVCPNCGGEMVYQGGCETCSSCATSKCE